MFPTTTELAFARFQKRRDPASLAIVFDRTAAELLRLARHLAPAGTEAEDLVQQTFVTAIEDAKSHRRGERVLPWLLGVLVNHARSARRRARRTLDAERLRAAADANSQDVAEALAEAELGTALRAAIDRLPEAYRPVLRLVCAHGLSAQEIATTLERPAGTVRAQVTRGLELLRRALPAGLAGGAALAVGSGRGLAAVRATVLGQCPGTTTGLLSAMGLGGLLVLQHKVATALVAVVLVGLGLWWFDREPPPPVAAQGATLDTARATGDLATLPPAIGYQRAPAVLPEASPEPALTAGEPDPVAKPTTGTLIVRLRTPDGTPLAGYGVAVCPQAAMQDLARDLDYRPTDADGEVHFADLTAGSWCIELDRIGVLAATELAAGETKRRTCTIPAGVQVKGRVVDGRGTPVPGAAIVLHASRLATTTVATTAADGTFTLLHLQSGVELQACHAGRIPSLAQPVRGAPGQTLALELQLGDQARAVRGTLLDAAGVPLGAAAIAILATDVRAASPFDSDRPLRRAAWRSTAADGTFACDEIGIGPHIVVAQPRGNDLAPCWTEIDTTPGDVQITLRANGGASVRGHVRRGDEPQRSVQIVSFVDNRDLGYLVNLLGLRQTTTDRDGAFVLRGLLPGPHQLRAMVGTSLLASTRRELVADGDILWDVDLAAGRELTIRVTADRLPQTPLVAFVYQPAAPDGTPPSMVPIQAGRGQLTSREGTVDVVLASLPGGTSLLQLAARRGVAESESEVVFALRAEDVPRHSIKGRLVDAQQAPRAGETIAAQRVGGDLVVRLETKAASDGSFALGPLPAGDYVLRAGPLRGPRLVGRAVVTVERDELVGDLVDRGN